MSVLTLAPSPRITRRRVAVAGRRVEDKMLTRAEVDALIRVLGHRALCADETAQQPAGRGRPPRPELHHALHLLVRLAAMTGARISELLALRGNDVRPVAGTGQVRIWVRRAKSGINGYVTIGIPLAHEVARLAGSKDDDEHLFSSASGASLPQSVLSHLLRSAFDEAGIRLKGRQTWHAMRSHAAWREWQRSRDLRSVQALLGHRSQHTTAHYLHLDERAREEKLAEALEGLSY